MPAHALICLLLLIIPVAAERPGGVNFSPPVAIGEDLKQPIANHGQEAVLLYREEGDELIAVWRTEESRKILLARAPDREWQRAVETPYTAPGRGAIDADFDTAGRLHFVMERFYGRETAPGEFAPRETVPHPGMGCSYKGNPVQFIHPNISVDKRGNVIYFVRSAWCDRERPYVMVRRGGTAQEAWQVRPELLGEGDLRPHAVWQQRSPDRSRIHFMWSSVAPEGSVHGKWSMALIHRQMDPSGFRWTGPGEAVSPYMPNGRSKKDFAPRIAVDNHGRAHAILLNHLKVSYVSQTSAGWSEVEVIDDATEEEWTMKIGHQWDLAVDSAGNVFAAYLIPSVGWRLKVRPTGENSVWGERIELPAEGYGYRLAAGSHGEVHMIYGANGKLWHRSLALKQ